MASRKSIVDQTIQFGSPVRIPLWVDGKNLAHSDILTYDLSLPHEDHPELNEWGYRRIKGENGRWAVPLEPALPTWPEVDYFQDNDVPQMEPARRLAGIADLLPVCGSRYRMASYGLSGYSVYSALRGAEFSAVDFLVETDRFVELMEYIFEFESEMFDLLVRKGFHAVEFCDDWGPRDSSRITLSLWRRLLKHHYAREFKKAKESGLHIWFSTSSESAEFFGDLKEIGVDVVRIETPYKMELADIGRQYRGKLCFAVRLDELITGQPEEMTIIRNIYECLGTPFGGFIGTAAGVASEPAITEIRHILNELDKN